MNGSIISKDWGSCGKKHKARNDTIINIYRKTFDRKTIPSGKQYWTLCGKSGMDSEGESGVLEGLVHGCELDEILTEKLIKPSQFRGVERDSAIHGINTTVKGVTWVHNDFYAAMLESFSDGDFNPAIVNYDSLRYPATSPEYTASIFKLIVDAEVYDVMLVINMVLKSHHKKTVSSEEILSQLYGSSTFAQSFQKAIRQGHPWKHDNKAYMYQGTGRSSRTIMGTVVFYR